MNPEDKPKDETDALDYSFHHDDNEWRVVHDGNSASIYDEDWEFVFTFPNFSIWTKGEAMPLALAKVALTIHRSAYAYGKKAGYRNAQFDIQKALGI